MNYKYIHLLYVPTMACNMACKYCYLEDNTKDDFKNYHALETLDYAIKKFKDFNVIPFNISLHGGEVTTLSHDDFYDLIKYIANYYLELNGQVDSMLESIEGNPRAHQEAVEYMYRQDINRSDLEMFANDNWEQMAELDAIEIE